MPPLPSRRRHCLCLPGVSTAFAAEALPLPGVSTAFAAETMPLPGVSTAFTAETLPLRATVFAAQTLPLPHKVCLNLTAAGHPVEHAGTRRCRNHRAVPTQ